MVVLLQKDSIERRGLKQLLFEPEVMANIEPSLDLAATVLAMKNMVPEKAKSAARELVRKVVEDVRKRLESQFVQAIRGALLRNRHGAFRSLPNLDWPRTIRRNLKNYDPDLKTFIPENLSFFSRQQRQNQWNVIIAMDQSGSMATSLIYGGIMGAILASIGSVETHVVAFNHEDVVDLTEHCSDPVDLLFGVQLGGAEDYWKATSYCERFMHTPARTLYVLLADLHDTSPNTKRFVKKMEHLLESGVKAIGLLAISDQGRPSFNESLANTLGGMGMPCFGCTPERLPELLAGVIRGDNLKTLSAKVATGEKAK
ncbi:MAG TPA: VWA domain-containing protein [Tepidisphaeraceae bacterium]|nr:VWA domain-containing protein [Tepidisphaeraceae bacterium]